MQAHEIINLYKDLCHTSVDFAVVSLYQRGWNDGILAASLQVPPDPPAVEVSSVSMRHDDLSPIQRAIIAAFQKRRSEDLTPIQTATILAFKR